VNPPHWYTSESSPAMKLPGYWKTTNRSFWNENVPEACTIVSWLTGVPAGIRRASLLYEKME
jgi:hypothetical protein